MESQLRSIAGRILESRKRIFLNAEELRLQNPDSPESREKGLIAAVEGKSFDGKVCAVDGGQLSDRFFGADISVSRSVASCFTYRDSRLVGTKYFPGRFPQNAVELKSGLDEHEALQFRSLFRLQGEIGCASLALGKFTPDYLLLDGSIVLLGCDKPSPDSMLFQEYSSLLNSYRELYCKCEAQGCQLAGVIKDSRGKRMAECLRDRLVVDVPDTVLADALLNEKERTCAIPYTANIPKHPVLSGLGKYAEKIRLFYTKPSSEDSPLRVEFLQGKKSADEVASAIQALSSISRAFAYPAALIDADMCAVLDPLEMDKIKQSLFVLTGGASRPLRRQARPFR